MYLRLTIYLCARFNCQRLLVPAYTHYPQIALQCSFPYAPKNHLRTLLIANRGHYAPTHLQLRARAATGQLGYTPKMTPFRAAAGERELIISKNADPAFTVELEWVRTREALGPGAADAEVEEAAEAGGRAVDALELPALVVEPEEAAGTSQGKGKGRALPDVEEDTEDGMGIECQCCFGDYPFVRPGLFYNTISAEKPLRIGENGAVPGGAPLLRGLSFHVRGDAAWPAHARVIVYARVGLWPTVSRV